MTRTQLKAMSTRELVRFAREFIVGRSETQRGLLIAEMADRLDDAFPFVSTPQPDPEQQELQA